MTLLHYAMLRQTRHEKLVYDLLGELDQQVHELEQTARAHLCMVPVFVHQGCLLRTNRLGVQHARNSKILRVGRCEHVVPDLSSAPPEWIGAAVTCIALRPLTHEELCAAGIQDRMRNALREAVRVCQKLENRAR